MAPMIELQTLRKLDHQPVSLIRHRYCASRAPLLADYTGGSLRQYLRERDLPLTRTQSLIGARLPNRDEAALLGIMERERVNAVMHLAAESHVDRSLDAPLDFVDTNVVGTVHLLNAALRHWRGLEGRARDRFRFSAFNWSVNSELPTVEGFETACEFIKPGDLKGKIPTGPDVEAHLDAIRKYIDAGFDHIALIGIGPDQAGFIDFFQRELRAKVVELA